MAATTAKTILQDLDRRRAQARLAALGDLDDEAHEAVRRALSPVPANSRIDLPVLIESVRKDIALRAQAKAERARQDAPLKRLQYQLSLISQGKLAELHAHLKEAEARGETQTTLDLSPGSARYEFNRRIDEIAERLGSRTDASTSKPTASAYTWTGLDDELDRLDGLDDEPAPRKRGGVRRVRSRRQTQQPDEPPREADRPAWLIDDSEKPPEPFPDDRRAGRYLSGTDRRDDLSFSGPL